jgi:hypothetical protein
MLEGKTVKSYGRLSVQRGQQLHLITFTDGSRISFQGNADVTPLLAPKWMKLFPEFFPPEEIERREKLAHAAGISLKRIQLSELRKKCEKLAQQLEKEGIHD